MDYYNQKTLAHNPKFGRNQSSSAIFKDSDSQINEDEDEIYNYKIILVGDSDVGKTSIITQYVDGTFSEDRIETRKVQIMHKMFTIDSEYQSGNTPCQADLHIWDTLGQEKFYSIASLFFKGTVGAFLVFDVTSRKSFEGLQRWYDKIIESCYS